MRNHVRKALDGLAGLAGPLFLLAIGLGFGVLLAWALTASTRR